MDIRSAQFFYKTGRLEQESDVHIEWTDDIITMSPMKPCKVSLKITITDNDIEEIYHEEVMLGGEKDITIRDITKNVL